VDAGTIVLAVVAFAALALLGWLAWVSLQSLLQARLLFHAARRFAAVARDGEAAALDGRAIVEHPLSLWGMKNLLYYRIEFYELRGYGRRRSWSKVGEEVKMAGLALEIGSRRVEVLDLPTEVQSTRSKTEYGSGQGWLNFGWWSMDDDKTKVHYLPVGTRVTVVGRLERRGDREALVRDSKVGLLLSPNPPERAAWIETAKGAGGLALVAAGWAAMIYLYSWFKAAS
jgi:hypothetical protein